MIGLPRKTIFIDRNSGGRIFRGLLTEAGINVVLHDEHFTRNTPDHVWLKKIGTLGWAMVTGDIAVEKSYLFLSALKHSHSHVFILCELNHALKEERARCIIEAYPEIITLCHAHSGPRLWKTNKSGKILPVNFKHSLGMLVRYERTKK